ncbi:beta strand repeat-containing protein [Deinococcus sp.]|uniref:beta strand repeat-containing protein n=1 Tax=Deinococcus sp. TaxID=47478 RepID=UPI003919F85D
MTAPKHTPALLLLTLTLAACGGGGTPTPIGTPVTSLADSGAGSLRDTLAAAKSGDTLRLTGTGTLTLASPLSIDKNVTIIATGVTIDAAGKGRALDIAKGATVTMQGGTLKGGTGAVLPASLRSAALPEHMNKAARARLQAANLNPQATTLTYGGVLSNAGTLTLDGVTITGGKANSGGGIYNTEGATLTLKGTTNVTGNEATALNSDVDTFDQGLGGGIYNRGTLTLAGGRIDGNRATWSGGGIVGAVGSVTNLTSGSVNDNACTRPLTGTTNADVDGCAGGGLYMLGDVTLGGASISGNTATHLGGGIMVTSSCVGAECTTIITPTFTMTGGTVENNRTTGKVDNGGGGLWLNAKSTISGGVIRGNSSMYGGGIDTWRDLTLTGGTIEKNTATESGGGIIFIRPGRTYRIGGTAQISGNTATGSGGGVTIVQNAQVTMDGGNISGNASKSGGGVSVSEDSKLTVKGGTVTQNTATANGGGLRTWRGSIDVQGGTISSNRADAEGGAISTEERGNVTVSGGLIENNTAGTWGGGINVRTEAAGLTVTGGTVRGNTAGKDGGGISAGRTINLAGATIEGNKATGGGGGVFMGVWNATTPMAATFGSGLVIRNNAATTGGGLQFLSSNASNATLTLNATISGNTATQWGGGIVGEAIINMMGGSINGNRATGTGQNQGGVGGVQLYAGANMTATGGTISDNEGRWAGGVQVSPPYGDKPAAQFTLAGATISGNRATEYNSGGINNGGKLTITAGSVTGNTAKMNGGGVFNSRTSTFTQTGGSVTGNNPNNVFNEQ